jgi:hypothetical protein
MVVSFGRSTQSDVVARPPFAKVLPDLRNGGFYLRQRLLKVESADDQNDCFDPRFDRRENRSALRPRGLEY